RPGAATELGDHEAVMTTPPAIEPDVVESVLDQLGLAHRRREESWAIAATARCPREMLIIPVEEGVRVEMTIISLEGAEEPQRQAVETFLRLAQPSLRYAHTEVRGDQLILAAQVSAASVETELEHAAVAVLAASQALARELAGLLQPELAKHYL